MFRTRPILSSVTLCIVVAAYVLALTNDTFWAKASAYYAADPLGLAAVALVVLLIYIVVAVTFSSKYVTKPTLIFFVMAAAGGSYFVDRFGVILDREMIRNAVTTTATEAGHLLTPDFAWHLLVFGILPSAAICWVRIRHRPFLAKLKQNSAVVFGCLAIASVLIFSQFSAMVSMWRQQREAMMSTLMPATPIVGAISLGVRQFREVGIKAEPYGLDAKQGSVIGAADRKVLTVIVVGETARAQNFAFNGYARDTNPELRARDVVAFTNVTSCGTATAVSLPCMFSHFGRADYSNIKGRGSENLMDVLKHAGLQLAWWENNTGTKNVADRIPTVDFYNRTDPRYCAGGECHDDILVDYLRDHIADLKTNAVLVLHSGGSHGPAYYLRYPDNFAKFVPDCRSAQISHCSREEIVNAYDNSILYTDHVLAEIVDILAAHEDKVAASMIYMSDHGESLGEDGLYLHGAPYFLAPETQTHIPMIAWFSPDYARIMGLDLACLRTRTADELSHDNLFATVLGMMDIRSTVYVETRDAFAACRMKPAVLGQNQDGAS